MFAQQRVTGREGAAEAPLARLVPPRPWLIPCLGMEQAPCCVSLTPRFIPSKERPWETFPRWCWGEQEGMGHPRDTARPQPCSDNCATLASHPGVCSVLVWWEAPWMVRLSPGNLGFLLKSLAHSKATETLALPFLPQWSKTKNLGQVLLCPAKTLHPPWSLNPGPSSQLLCLQQCQGTCSILTF